MGRAFTAGRCWAPGGGGERVEDPPNLCGSALVDGWQGTLYRFLSARTINEKASCEFSKISPEITQRDAKFQRFSMFTPFYECELNEAINSEAFEYLFS